MSTRGLAKDEHVRREEFTVQRRRRWDVIATRGPQFLGSQYQRRITKVYRSIIPEGARVLELGCAWGRLLHAVSPAYGVGVDFSPAMVRHARQNYPDLHIVEADAHDVRLDETFDYIILQDLLNDVWDVQALLANLRSMCKPSTRVIINTYSKLWQPLLNGSQKVGLTAPLLQQNWFTQQDTRNLLELEGFEIVRRFPDVLLPLNIPVLAPLANRYLSKILPFRWLDLTNFSVARLPMRPWKDESPKVSVVCPTRNESGNIPRIFDLLPDMPGGVELLFVEGGSTDNTYETIQEEMKRRPETDARLFKQPGKGKGDAVRHGFSHAHGDVFIILDADLTVAPEMLPRFIAVLEQGSGEFVNGVRLVYPMHEEAMRFFNLMGNKFFSAVFTWLLGQPVKDTLCGAKAISRDNYQRLAANRAVFGEFDPFGDFDLLFGSAKQHLKIVDLPVRYAERVYGDTNISRWRDGALLLRMVAIAARRIKFSP